jgi:hypothetical protein
MRRIIARYAWVAVGLLGIVLVASGAYMVLEGRQAHDDVRDTLADERIITSQNAEIPLKPVTGPDEAKAQADVIRQDALKATGGKTYAELDQNDPTRATYLQSVTLRTALMQSYMAFKVADLVVGVGLLVGVLGLALIGLGSYLGLVIVRPPELRRRGLTMAPEA